MLDPLTAIALTASVVQLVGSSYTFVSACQEAYNAKTTSTSRNVDLAAITQDLERVNEDLIKSLSSATLNIPPDPATATNQTHDISDKALINLAKRCQVAGEVLLRRLYELRITTQDSGWRAFRQGIKAAWSKNEVNEMAQTLSEYRTQLQLHLVASVRTRFDLQTECQTERWKALDVQTKETINLLITSRDLLMQELQAHSQVLRDMETQQERQSRDRFDEFRRRCDDAESSAAHRHEEVKSWHEFYSDIANQRNQDILAVINDTQAKYNHVNIEKRVLRHLKFDTMELRRDEVAETYAKTFEWVFSSRDGSTQSGSNLMDFLENGTGCYWLNGKPGSGKSTLMKLVTDNGQTTAALCKWTPVLTKAADLREEWAPLHGLVQASFFFWYAGSFMQKSQLGLLQTILYEILVQCPALIPIVLPKLCEEAASDVISLSTLSFSQIKTALMEVVRLSEEQFGICLFVDGLDEYDAVQSTHTELAEFFIDLCRSKNIKAVISSRPLPAFEHIFSECPQLRLQDLTKPDIEFYAQDRLRNTSRISYLMEEYPKAVDELIDEITSKASGVFLWVRLTVSSLIEGLHAHDTVRDLQDRLRELPDDLDDLYMHILKRIAPRYRQEASQILLMVSWHMLDYGSRLTTLDVSLALEPGAILEIDAREMTESEVISRAKSIQGRIKSRCFGLLEVHCREPSDEDIGFRVRTQNKRGLEIGNARNYEFWSHAEVDFLHKTAADFLRQKSIQQYLLQFTPNIHPLKALLTSSVARARTLPSEQITAVPYSDMGDAISRSLTYALRYSEETNSLLMRLLDKLGEAVAWHRHAAGLWQTSESPGASSARWGAHASFEQYEPFVGMALRYGLIEYLSKWKLEEQRLTLTLLEANERPLLFSALTTRTIVHAKFTEWPSANVVQFLLEQGADPNAVWRGMTPWAYACIQFHELYRATIASGISMRSQREDNYSRYSREVGDISPKRYRRDYARIIEVLIKANADPNVLFEKRIGQGSNSRQTLSPIDAIELTCEGDSTIFNTPNRKPLPPQQYEIDLIQLLQEQGGSRHNEVVRFEGERWDRPTKDFWTTDVVRNSAWGPWRLAGDREYTIPAADECVKAVWFRMDDESREPCEIEVKGNFEVFERGIHNHDRWPEDLDKDFLIDDEVFL